jgi:hypothetical protein
MNSVIDTNMGFGFAFGLRKDGNPSAPLQALLLAACRRENVTTGYTLPLPDGHGSVKHAQAMVTNSPRHAASCLVYIRQALERTA